jgi:hypothetical protein
MVFRSKCGLLAVVWATLFCALASVQAFALGEKQYVVTKPEAGSFPLAVDGKVSPLVVEKDDYPGVQRAVHSLAGDLQAVTGLTPAMPAALGKGTVGKEIVLIGTIGHSPAVDALIASGKLDVSAIRGHWETSVTQIVDRPMPGVRRALVIAGADKRGTIYGIYDLSEQIGVSPWAWWADVPVRHQADLFVIAGRYLQMEPHVKYRGIFLNDEAPALTGWANEKFGGFNHKFYEHIFELLLRLKANFLWPAMWNSAFNEDDPADPKLADEYGIVMGTSHHEPMMRAQQEWKRHGVGAWDYSTNAANLDDFWRAGVRRNRSYEELTTIGMRGDGDMAMSAATNTALLEKIVADQRKILTEEVNSDVTKVPQVWALYKEVQDYYEAGMRVPDDVTLLWCDDNWGNIRRLPTPEERKRPGGAGIYYHFDYVGDPRSYKWLLTYPIPKIWEQMNLAVNYGADRMWIVNVGDLKPMEFPIEFFLDLARTPDRWGKDNLQEYTRLWAAREFGPEYANEIAQLVAEYTKYNGRRKPEQIDADTFVDQDENDRMLAEYQSTVARAEALSAKLSPAARDAFFELVLYPAKASETVLEMNILAGLNHLYSKQGRASTNDLAAKVNALFVQDAALTNQYNHKLANGKWDHMMDQTHIGYFYWNEPPLNIMPPVSFVALRHGASMGLAVEGDVPPEAVSALPRFDGFTRRTHYVDIFNTGDTPFQYQASASAPWIKLSSTTGKVDNQGNKDVRLEVGIDWDALPVGDARGSITIFQQGGSRRTLAVEVTNPAVPTRASLEGFVETDGVVSIEAEHFTSLRKGAAASWQKIPDFGETLSGMTIFPVDSPSVTKPADSACMDYQMYLFEQGDRTVEAILAPTLKFVPGRSLRYALAFDDQPPQIVDAWQSDTTQDWSKAVSDGVHRVVTQVAIPNSDGAGYHTLHFCSVDPGVVLEKLVVSLRQKDNTYLGPVESFHR